MLVRAGRDHYVGLKHGGIIRDGSFVTYANFEHFQGGRNIFHTSGGLNDLPTYLRLERHGDKLYASGSHDGVLSVAFAPADVHLPNQVEVGVAAVNSSSQPFNAELEDFKVFTLKDAPAH